LIPKGSRNSISGLTQKPSERSDADTSIVEEVFGVVKRNLSRETQNQNTARTLLWERWSGRGDNALSGFAGALSLLKRYSRPFPDGVSVRVLTKSAVHGSHTKRQKLYVKHEVAPGSSNHEMRITVINQGKGESEGLYVGLAGLFAATRLLSSQIYGVSGPGKTSQNMAALRCTDAP